MGLVQQIATIVATPSKAFDWRYPDGNDGSSSTLSWATVPDFLQQAGGFSINLATYLTIPGGGTATYTLLSGTLLGDWALASNGMFTGTTVGGPGTFRVRATKSAVTADCNSFQVESIASGGSTDVTAPTQPLGLSQTAVANTTADVTVDPSADVPYSTQDRKGMKEMRFFKNGAFDGATSVSGGMAVKFALAETPAIGTKRFPRGHVVSIPYFEAVGSGNRLPTGTGGAQGDDATYPLGSIPGGHLGTSAGLARNTDGPANDGVVMIVQPFYWAELEPTQNSYDFTRMADDLKQCHALGVYYCPIIIVRTFNGSGGTGADNPAPNYLGGLTTPSTAHDYCTYYSPSNGGYQMWRWDTFVKQRFAALVAAIYAQFDKNTAEYVHFAGVCTQETACNMSDAEQNAAGYTITKYLAGLNAEVDATSAGTYCVGYHMYNQMPANPAGSGDTMSGNTALDTYVEYIATKGDVLGGPDILPQNSGLVSNTYPRYSLVAGKCRKFCSMQNTSMQASQGLKVTWEYGRDNLGISQCWWNWRRSGGANYYEHGTDAAIDVIKNDYNASPARTPFGSWVAGACTQTGVDYSVASNWEGAASDGTADSYSSGRATVSGDFYFSACVDSLTGTLLTKAYAGLAVRDAAGNDQRMVRIYVTGTKLVAEYRSATGAKILSIGTVSGVTWTSKTYLKIKRAGNVFSCYYSKDALSWIQVGAGTTVAMTDPVIADIFCVAGGYAQVTAAIKNVCLNNLAAATYHYTGLTAGTQYTFSVKGRDLATSPNDSVASPNLLVTTTGASITRKWDPGRYVMSNSKATALDDASTTFQNDITKISAMGGMMGICLQYAWACFESAAAGSYDYTILDRDINRCSSAGKKLAIRILDRNFSGTTPVGAGILPDYLLNDPTTFGAGSDGTHGGYWKKSGNGYTAAVWRAAVMDRVIAQLADLAAHTDPALGGSLDASSNIAWIEFCTSDLFLGSGSDYTFSGLVTQLKRLMTAVAISWPHTPFRLVLGTLSGGAAADMSDLVNTAHTSKVAIGGFDVKGINTTLANRYFDAQKAWCGTLDGTSVDQRGSMPIIQQVNTGELTGSQYAADGSPYSNADLQSTLAFLGTNYAVWQIVNASGSGNWTASVQPYLATNPAVVATRPTGW